MRPLPAVAPAIEDGTRVCSDAAARESAELKRAFGEGNVRLSELNWEEHARRLVNYVRRPDRAAVTSYDAIRSALAEMWGVPVVETQHAVGAMGPLADADRDYGRCSVRLLDLLGQSNVYVVVRRREGRGSQRMLWALLHELGHLVLHFEQLFGLSRLYQRVCLDPSLERHIGKFARESARMVHAQNELDADRFAIDWLLPAWIDDDDQVAHRAPVGMGLTPDGYRYYRLRRVLDDSPYCLHPEASQQFNRAGEDERCRAKGEFLPSHSPWRRASWVLFNRGRLPAQGDYTTSYLCQHDDMMRYLPRHVPELTRSSSGQARPLHDEGLNWLRRVSPAAVASEVDGVQWAPLLVLGSHVHPAFHVPIRPLPSRSGKDSTNGWKHMCGPAAAAPRPLEEWLWRAQSQSAGLLLFPRNPAERALDAEGQVRA